MWLVAAHIQADALTLLDKCTGVSVSYEGSLAIYVGADAD